ncbi:hypothetical protein BKA63DRAFT_260877 [Paraphoma chrysanthemicola]|nr:hypothetical protein BKA63DRAFT_260877 [Paraphoma chrysanthemicola]
MAGDINNDEYIASLMKQDAKNATKKYELVGIDAFNPKRSKSGAPKPNTNFLRHIIRQTDSHNAALLAREAEESNARLRRMNHDKARAVKREEVRKERKTEGRLTPVLSDEEEAQRRPSKRRHDDDRQDGGRYDNRKRRRRSEDSQSRKHRSRSRSRDRHRDRRKHDDRENRSAGRKKSVEHRRDRRHSDSEEETLRKKHKSSSRHHRRRSRSASSVGSRSPPSHTNQSKTRHGRRDRSRSPGPSSRRHRADKSSSKEAASSSKHRRHSPAPASDSDPLEAIVGPLPPHMAPSVRSRGRGAHKANSMGMDSRFSSTYNPAMDARPPSDVEDDWGESVDAFRDRMRWKQQGAERLKAAGFTDDQVKKWEKGDMKDEQDVTWTKSGQKREWDRGKVVDEDGDVDVKAEWGRLT